MTVDEGQADLDDDDDDDEVGDGLINTDDLLNTVCRNSKYKICC